MTPHPNKRRGPMTWLAGRSGRWWIAVAVLLPVLYVASFGPACWWFPTPRPSPEFPEYFGMAGAPQWYAPRVFWPIGYAAAHGPWKVREAIEWYAAAGTSERIGIPYMADGDSCIVVN